MVEIAPDTWKSMLESSDLNTFVRSEQEKDFKKTQSKLANEAYKNSNEYVLEAYQAIENSFKENSLIKEKLASIKNEIKTNPSYRAKFHPMTAEIILNIDLGENDQ